MAADLRLPGYDMWRQRWSVHACASGFRAALTVPLMRFIAIFFPSVIQSHVCIFFHCLVPRYSILIFVLQESCGATQNCYFYDMPKYHLIVHLGCAIFVYASSVFYTGFTTFFSIESILKTTLISYRTDLKMHRKWSNSGSYCGDRGQRLEGRGVWDLGDMDLKIQNHWLSLGDA